MNATKVQKQQLLDIQAKISYCECPSSTMLIYKLPYLTLHGNTYFPTVTLHVHLKLKKVCRQQLQRQNTIEDTPLQWCICLR